MGDLPASLAAARQRALNGGQRPRPRPLPRTPQQPYRSAFWDAPETNLPYRAPEQALADRNTLSYQRQETLPQRQVRNDMAQLADRSAAGGSTGYAERNQVREFGNSLMEATGAPSWARGIEDIQYGQPGAAIPEFLNGALATSSLATLPYGAGASAPIRRFQRAPRLPQAELPQSTLGGNSRTYSHPIASDEGLGINVDMLPSSNTPDEFTVHWGFDAPSSVIGRERTPSQKGRIGLEAIERVVQTVRQDALTNPNASYRVGGATDALSRRYLRTAMQQAEQEGFAIQPHADGGFVISRSPIRQSMVGGSNDLAEAAGMRPQQAPPRTTEALDAGQAQNTTGVLGRLRGEQRYETDNAVATIRQRADGLRDLEWNLKDGSASFSLADRAAAEAEGIRAMREAFLADAAANPGASYYYEPATAALARRNRRMAEAEGFTVTQRGNGFVISREAGASNARPPPRTPPRPKPPRRQQ